MNHNLRNTGFANFQEFSVSLSGPLPVQVQPVQCRNFFEFGIAPHFQTNNSCGPVGPRKASTTYRPYFSTHIRGGCRPPGPPRFLLGESLLCSTEVIDNLIHSAFEGVLRIPTSSFCPAVLILVDESVAGVSEGAEMLAAWAIHSDFSRISSKSGCKHS
jgi:hypothetical protein